MTQNTRILISKLLLAAGIPSNCDGYDYIQLSIEIGLDDGEALKQITKVLYPEVAEKTAGTEAAVEHSIRTAIAAGWNKDNFQHLAHMLGVEDIFPERPTASEFICTIVRCIHLGIIS